MSIMEMFGYPSAAQARANLLKAVREAGASRIEASYSGGNDEGGVDSVKAFDASGAEVEIAYDENHEWGGALYEAANDMLATEFGSWAGDFSAYGTLYADLKEGRVWRDGSVQEGYDSDSTEY